MLSFSYFEVNFIRDLYLEQQAQEDSGRQVVVVVVCSVEADNSRTRPEAGCLVKEAWAVEVFSLLAHSRLLLQEVVSSDNNNSSLLRDCSVREMRLAKV
jgi:hypothetical protein